MVHYCQRTSRFAPTPAVRAQLLAVQVQIAQNEEMKVALCSFISENDDIQRVEEGFCGFTGHMPVVCLAGYARAIDVKSKAVAAIDAKDMGATLSALDDPAHKYSLKRDNGHLVLIPTVAGIASAAGSCGVQPGFHNLFCAHSIESEQIVEGNHVITAPRAGLK